MHYPKLHQAIAFAVAAHMGQDRKYSKIPYIVHPINVMQIVRSVSDDEDMLVAAILHDVIEDTPTSIKEISAEFGDSVGSLVDDLTDPSKPEDGNRKDRKIIDREHTAAAQADAKTIKLADLIHNTDSIAGSDEHFARVFMRESEALLEVLKEGNPALLARAQQSLRLLGIQSNRFPW